jgi:hypothetical protein
MSAYWTKKEIETEIKECKKNLKVIKNFQEIDRVYDLLDKKNLTKVLDYKGLLRLTITAFEKDLREKNYVKEGKK